MHNILPTYNTYFTLVDMYLIFITLSNSQGTQYAGVETNYSRDVRATMPLNVPAINNYKRPYIH